MTITHTNRLSSSPSAQSQTQNVKRKFGSPKVTLFLLLLFMAISHWEPETSPSIALPHGTSLQKAYIPNRIVYVGKYGLGHRLGKMAGAFHVARQLRTKLNLPLAMEAQWGVCQDGNGELPEDHGGKIFDYLFGSNEIQIPSRMTGNSKNTYNNRPSAEKQLWIRNDCHGYYTGQSYKNTRQPIPRHYLIDNEASPWFQKMDSDAKLFRLLQRRYLKIHPEPLQFMQQHRFAEHTVLGLHIRAGNGETDHFVSANRGVAMQEDQFLHNLMALLGKFLLQSADVILSKPPLLFLATDTPTTVIPIVQKATQAWKIPLATFPQPQLPPSQGVTYSALKVGQPCFLAWKAMMADVILLSHADVLIAGMRSSFTQIMPMSMVLNSVNLNKNKNNNKQTRKIIKSPIHLQNPNGVVTTPRFCEVSETGAAMTCIQDRQAWMSRNTTNQWSLSVSSPTSSSSSTSTSASPNNATATTTTTTSEAPVVHKVVVHFPDVDGDVETRMEKALSFFQQQQQQQKGIGETEAMSAPFKMAWGDKLIDTKYRQRLKGSENIPDWTLGGA